MEFSIDTADIDAIRNVLSHPGTAITIEEYTANWEKAYGRTAL